MKTIISFALLVSTFALLPFATAKDFEDRDGGALDVITNSDATIIFVHPFAKYMGGLFDGDHVEGSFASASSYSGMCKRLERLPLTKADDSDTFVVSSSVYENGKPVNVVAKINTRGLFAHELRKDDNYPGKPDVLEVVDYVACDNSARRRPIAETAGHTINNTDGSHSIIKPGLSRFALSSESDLDGVCKLYGFAQSANSKLNNSNRKRDSRDPAISIGSNGRFKSFSYSSTLAEIRCTGVNPDLKHL